MTDAEAPVARARAAFVQRFGSAADHAARAPGRVNLIGEHTDYNDGFVLPCAIGFHTVVAGSANRSRQIRVVAADWQMSADSFSLDAPITPLPAGAANAWANYVRGVVQQLLHSGHAIDGADLAIAGNVPHGAGLSSSAALEVALGQFFTQAFALALPPTANALNAQAAENRFVGIRCGIMDMFASALGRAGHALLIDCRTLQARPISIPADTAVMIVHSHVRRGLVDSAYNTRRQQCETAARHFGVAALRDVDEAMLKFHSARLDPVVLRRARHIVGENRRTLAAGEALAQGDLPAMGRLMAQSHTSMRDDFNITHPAVDRLVAVLQASIGSAGGARMTGGGFGGCAVALLPQAAVPQVREAVAAQYRSPQGEPGTVWVCHASAGAGVSAG